jgi:hypothetical protein
MAVITSSSWHDWWRYIHPFIYFIKWPLYFVAGWTAIYFRRWRKARVEEQAQGWPSVEGLVIGGKVSPIPKTSQFHASLQYTYFVGEYRTGKYDHDFSSEEQADEFVRAMKDKRVQIRYDSSNPDRSVLEQRIIEQHALLTPRFG